MKTKKVIPILPYQIKHKSKNFCPAPFRQIAINNLGQLSACCMINQEGFGYFNEDLNISINSLYSGKAWRKFFKSHVNEQLPALCESACGMHYPSEYHQQWTYVEQEGWTEKKIDITRADIAFSNLCNLSCTMCAPHWSSEWQKILRNQGMPLPEGLTAWNFSEKQIKELAKLLSGCQLINIKGGEPFFNPRFKLFLKYLYDLNPDVSLPILSNGTIVEDACFNILSKFKNAQYTISLESTRNDLYRLIRGGVKFSYDQIKDNVKKIRHNYPTMKIKSNYILGSFNIDNFQEDMNRLRQDGFSEVNILCVHHPIEQGIGILNRTCKDRFLTAFKNELNSFPDFYKTMKKDNNDNQILAELSADTSLNLSIDEILNLENKCLEHIQRRNDEGCNFIEDILILVPEYKNNLNCNVSL